MYAVIGEMHESGLPEKTNFFESSHLHVTVAFYLL